MKYGRYYIGIVIVALGWVAGSLLANRVQANADTAPPALNERRHVAVMGDPADIDKAVKDLVERRQLRLLRNYPTPAAYLEEGGFSDAAALRLYEVLTPTIAASGVVSAAIALGQDNALPVKPDSLDWTTHLPDQVLVSGLCGEIVVVSDAMNAANPDLNLQPLGKVRLNYRELAANSTESLCIAAFTFAPNFRVAEVVAQFNERGVTVLAEPNYLATGAQYIAGSPGGPQLPAPTLLGLRSPLTTTGQGVRIYAFDSIAPYTLTAPITREVEVNGSGLTVTLHAFVPLPPNLPDAPAAPGHGTFVLSPILQLAPDTDIHLVRTLNTAVVGDGWTFIQSLDQVIRSLPPDQPTIFNYSFGLAGPNQPTLDNALVRLLWEIDQLGIPQVGASGNDSNNTSQARRDILPARHPNVISVAAVTKNGDLACYSNQGEISALGGGIARVNGRVCDTEQIVATCNVANARCVSGWAPRPQGSVYSWGLGTSFAAPIISAVAAQSAEQLVASGRDATPSAIRNQLQELVNAGCDLNTGIGCLP